MKKEYKYVNNRFRVVLTLIQLVFGASHLVCLGVHKVGGVPK